MEEILIDLPPRIGISGIGIDDGVKTLTTFSKKIDTDAMRSPSFLMILTASGDFAYRRDDGILVVPIGCLKP